MLVLQYIRPFTLLINVAEKIGLFDFLCCFKLHDICIDNANYLIYIVPFPIFSYHPKFIGCIPNSTLVKKFIIQVLVQKFFQKRALFHSRVAKMFFKLNYKFYEATKLFRIIGNITYVVHGGNLFRLQIFLIKRCSFSITKS